ncbi:MAG: hypothetical protein Q7U75_08525 [Desulfobacterales bacterium]|nr:hypothetical protein [Desulfobacterales bacterium]
MDPRGSATVPIWRYRKIAKARVNNTQRDRFIKACQSYQSAVMELRIGDMLLVDFQNFEPTGDSEHIVDVVISRNRIIKTNKA